MTATALSRIVRMNGATIKIIEEILLIDSIAFPRRVISKCPAIMFAVSRTHRVMGRIMFLVNSISTINLIRAEGVPCGTKCANI